MPGMLMGENSTGRGDRPSRRRSGWIVTALACFVLAPRVEAQSIGGATLLPDSVRPAHSAFSRLDPHRLAGRMHGIPIAISNPPTNDFPPPQSLGIGSSENSEGSLFGRRDALILAGFATAAFALGPLDDELAGVARGSDLQTNAVIGRSATALEWLGFPGVVVLSGGAYVGGLLIGDRDLADVGLHTFGAIGVAEVLTVAIKGVAGRARPHTGGEDAYDFQLFRGFRGDAYQSFPSAHTTAAFAAAAALTSEVGERSPGATWWVGAISFGGATLVGLSRMYHDEHWASDVAVGAAVGSFGGWKVTRYLHDRGGNWIDRRFLPRVSPAPGGEFALIWTIQPPGRFQ